ncbi:hypothetical protein [Marinobacterium aestuariivivens]|uniref:Uncharacterized protein n=1 Tax=Marinobacterium aestuariivivens TaxID=1698799 RepID=A0ABW2A920_9GAMM
MVKSQHTGLYAIACGQKSPGAASGFVMLGGVLAILVPQPHSEYSELRGKKHG